MNGADEKTLCLKTKSVLNMLLLREKIMKVLVFWLKNGLETSCLVNWESILFWKNALINLIAPLIFYCRKTTSEILVICMIRILIFRSLYRVMYIRARTLFMLHRIQVFIHSNTMHWTKGFAKRCFEENMTTTALVMNI